MALPCRDSPDGGLRGRLGRQGAAHRLVVALRAEVPSAWIRHSIFPLCFFSLICRMGGHGDTVKRRDRARPWSSRLWVFPAH